MRRRGLSITVETENKPPEDNLEVTKAIEIVQSTNDISDVDSVAAKQDEIIAQQQELDENDSADADADMTTSSDGEEGSDFELDESSDVNTDEDIDGLADAVDDTEALEALIEKFSNSTVTTESFDCASLGLTLEAGSVKDAIWDTLKRVWQKLVEFVGRIAETVSTFIALQKSKLGTAKEEITNLKISVGKIFAEQKARRETIDSIPMAQLLTTTMDKNDKAEMFLSIANHSKIVESYFGHLRSHYATYVDSINKVLASGDEFPEGLEGNILVSRNTLPSVMTKVKDIDGQRKPLPTMETYRSPVMAKGTMIAAFVTTDTSVKFGTSRSSTDSASVQDSDKSNDVLNSKMILCLDHSYSSEVETLPVMSKGDLLKYLDQMEHLRQHLSQAEGLLMIYAKSINEFKKQISKASKDSLTLANAEKSDEVMVQAQGKRVVGTTLSACMVLTESFYGRPSLSMMQFSNHVLSAAVKYVVDCINAYTYVKKKDDKGTES